MPRSPVCLPTGDRIQPWRLKYCTARSCFFAASRVSNVPRFLRFPVFGFFFTEYSRYLPDFSFRIINASFGPGLKRPSPVSSCLLSHQAARRARVRAAFRAEADRSAAGRAADALPPFLPPFFAAALFPCLPRPEPLFFPPPLMSLQSPTRGVRLRLRIRRGLCSPPRCARPGVSVCQCISICLLLAFVRSSFLDTLKRR